MNILDSRFRYACADTHADNETLLALRLRAKRAETPIECVTKVVHRHAERYDPSAAPRVPYVVEAAHV